MLILDEGTFFCQAKYTQDMLKKFEMANACPLRFPMSTSVKLKLDHEGISVDQKLYRSMIGSLLYLCASRPDIVFSVGLCARFQSNPKESHMTAVKRILRYLVDNLIMVFGIPPIQSLILWGIRMRIGDVT